MLYSSLLVVAQLAMLATAVPAPQASATGSAPTASGSAAPAASGNTTMPKPLTDSTTVPEAKGPNALAGNKKMIEALTLAATEKDRISLIKNNVDFVYDFNDPPKSAITTGKGGHTVKTDREVFPALIGTGVSMTLGFLGPCGFNTPHTHPRSAEINVVVKGSLIAEFTVENGDKTVTNKLNLNQMTVFPQGALHTEFNPTCEDAQFVAGFASEDPGVQQAIQSFVGFDDDIVLAALGGDAFDGASLDKVRSLIPANVANGVEKCLKQCNIKKA